MKNESGPKPCPFCGGKAKAIQRSGFDYGSYYYFVTCSHCEAKTKDYDSAVVALKSWNQRAELTA